MNFPEIYQKSIFTDCILNDLLYCTVDESSYLYILAYNKYTLHTSATLRISPMDCFCIIAVTNGNAIVNISGKIHTFSSGNLYIFDCRLYHEFSCTSLKLEYYVIYFDGNGMDFFSPQLFKHDIRLFDTVIRPEYTEKFSDLIRYNSVYCINSLITLKFMTDFLVDILTFGNVSFSVDSSIPEYLIQIKLLFDDEYYLQYSLDELQHRFHINKYKIVKDFTKHFGCSPIQYLNKHRIDIAAQLLTRSGDRINEIGYRVGFETTNHFIQLFKKQTGMTPAIYRKAHTNIK